jgi:cytoskeletal protein CcmA (bactofilin family)
MFGKTGDKEDGVVQQSRGSEPSFEVRTRSVSVIGPTLKFKGELTANEDLIIEGQIEGKIAHQEKNLTVGKSGRVKADIHAKEIEIQGRVDGDIRGDDIVKLAKSAVVQGNIHCGRIVMEDGAHFSGSITMEARAPKPAVQDTTIDEKPGSEKKSGKITSVAG